MNSSKILRGALVAAALAVAPLTASFATSPAPDAAIPFANHGGIRDWQADRDQGLWIQDVRRNWYYAKLMAPCIGLNFATSLGFDTRPMGTFDRFSAIVVPREGRCVVQSLAPSGPPPTKAQLKSQAATAAPKFAG
jgi:Family of unknown function (DUF6491)